jgi:head-tail adaptor
MQAGQLRQIVAIQQPTGTDDGTGQRVYTYATTEPKVWAKVRNVSQSKGMDGDVVAAGLERYEVRMRFRTGVDYLTRIIFGDLVLQVVGVNNVMERDHELQLDCEVADR